jgi:hypothetical protein
MDHVAGGRTTRPGEGAISAIPSKFCSPGTVDIMGWVIPFGAILALWMFSISGLYPLEPVIPTPTHVHTSQDNLNVSRRGHVELRGVKRRPLVDTTGQHVLANVPRI